MLPHTVRTRAILLVVLLATAAAVPAMAQGQPVAQKPVTAADYARAEKFLASGVMPLVVGGTVQPSWLPDDRFYYRNTTAEGSEFVLVSPATKSRGPAFDHVKLAAALSAAAGSTYDPKKLPFTAITLSPDAKTVSFDLEKRRWTCDVQGAKCEATGAATGAGMPGGGRGGRGGVAGSAPGVPPTAPSPDGKRAVFIRDWNLWVRDVATGQEKPLTTDGVKNFGYATDNAGWATSDRPIVLWSPDSTKVATYQQDERKVGEMYLVETKVGHPRLQRVEVPAARRRGGRDAAEGDHRHGHGQDHPVRHAAGLPPGDARRQLQRQRHAVEPGRDQARVRVHDTRSQAGDPASGRRRHRRRPHGLRGDGEDALRIDRRLARALGDQRGDLVLPARRLGAPLPLRPGDRDAQEPHHLGRGAGHADHQGGRENAHGVVRRDGPREGPGPVLPAPLSRRPGRQELRVPDTRDRRPQRAALTLGQVHRRHLLHVRGSAGRRPSRHRRQGSDDAREGGHLRSCWQPVGSRPFRSR